MRLHLYTTEAQALSVTHARIVYRTRVIRSVVYGTNAEYLHVSRIKMADNRALVSIIIIIHTNKGAEMKRSI